MKNVVDCQSNLERGEFVVDENVVELELLEQLLAGSLLLGQAPTKYAHFKARLCLPSVRS